MCQLERLHWVLVDCLLQIAAVSSGHYLPFSDAFWIFLLNNLLISLSFFDHEEKQVLNEFLLLTCIPMSPL